MASAGVPMRALQRWMGHRDYKKTLIYADYAPIAHERELGERAFGAADPIPASPDQGKRSEDRRTDNTGAISEVHEALGDEDQRRAARRADS